MAVSRWLGSCQKHKKRTGVAVTIYFLVPNPRSLIVEPNRKSNNQWRLTPYFLS